MSKIGLSGASGFVGKNFMEYLTAMGHEVRVLQLREPLNENSLTGCDTIIHLAGKAHDLRNISQPEEYYRTNFELTKNLYDLFLRSDASKFIFMSSVKAVADQTNGPLTETDIPLPVTHYGKSKLMAEQYIQTKVVPVKTFYILRPCMIHGPGSKGNFNLLFRLVKAGLPYPLGSFENKRSFLSIENLCFVVNELVCRQLPGGIYNVADSEPLSTNDLIRQIAQALGTKPKIWFLNKKFVIKMAKIGDSLHLPFNSSRLHKLTENFEVSNRKLIDILQKSLPVKAKEGINNTVKWFKKS